ncbi:MAG: hypothetical protein KGI50_04190 [Patescibacteria group bacterium]|nr:hypothetical protein [Patescibacteria group bacterium]MDE2438514.1 hypothetical protein [Patescibacteria group bacterium]
MRFSLHKKVLILVLVVAVFVAQTGVTHAALTSTIALLKQAGISATRINDVYNALNICSVDALHNLAVGDGLSNTAADAALKGLGVTVSGGLGALINSPFDLINDAFNKKELAQDTKDVIVRCQEITADLAGITTDAGIYTAAVTESNVHTAAAYASCGAALDPSLCWTTVEALQAAESTKVIGLLAQLNTELDAVSDKIHKLQDLVRQQAIDRNTRKAAEEATKQRQLIQFNSILTKITERMKLALVESVKSKILGILQNDGSPQWITNWTTRYTNTFFDTYEQKYVNYNAIYNTQHGYYSSRFATFDGFMSALQSDPSQLPGANHAFQGLNVLIRNSVAGNSAQTAANAQQAEDVANNGMQGKGHCENDNGDNASASHKAQSSSQNCPPGQHWVTDTPGLAFSDMLQQFLGIDIQQMLNNTIENWVNQFLNDNVINKLSGNGGGGGGGGGSIGGTVTLASLQTGGGTTDVASSQIDCSAFPPGSAQDNCLLASGLHDQGAQITESQIDTTLNSTDASGKTFVERLASSTEQLQAIVGAINSNNASSTLLLASCPSEHDALAANAQQNATLLGVVQPLIDTFTAAQMQIASSTATSSPTIDVLMTYQSFLDGIQASLDTAQTNIPSYFSQAQILADDISNIQTRCAAPQQATP